MLLELGLTQDQNQYKNLNLEHDPYQINESCSIMLLFQEYEQNQEKSKARPKSRLMSGLSHILHHDRTKSKTRLKLISNPDYDQNQTKKDLHRLSIDVLSEVGNLI